jgi:hypothetical protein
MGGRDDTWPPMRPLQTYLTQLVRTRASHAHTPETSFYPALKALLDSVGERLSPPVLCVMNLRNAGAGLPDGGLFTTDQLEQSTADAASELKPPLQAIPSRGAIEVKPPSQNLETLANSPQVSRYGDRYRHVLITNLREFWLVEHSEGQNRVRERFTLASNERDFWRLAASAEDISSREAELLEFFERVLRTGAPLGDPEDVAWFLASYARDALRAVEHAPTGVMEDISDALSNALGMAFGGTKGRHFFHSTLVQTLFYGVFSAWVIWGQQPRSPDERFSWRDTTDLLHLPILRVLFHEMTRPTLLFTNALRARLDLAESALNRIDRTSFYRRFPQNEAVQYFYEPFLEAFDTELRWQLGVWYTPEEVVRYIVERIDRTLRTDLGLPAGLADPSVVVLDPACGTGAFLLAVLERIAKTLDEQGAGATLGARILEAATTRLHGFEILPAPFVIAHLQISLYLRRLGVTVPEGARPGVYLTNALTGWGRPLGRQAKLPAEFADERAAATHIKQRAPVLVVLGNPPYSAYAGVQPKEEQESVDVYKDGLRNVWKVRKFNLDELFVRFFRLAERKIAEQSKRGVVCFISNASYIADQSFVVLRERFAHQFNTITIDNLNGDSRETGKTTPDGKPDPSIFSTDRNREGIRVGTAIGLFTRNAEKPKRNEAARIRWREFWGVDKRRQLLESLTHPDEYITFEPDARTKWSFRPRHARATYKTWHPLTALCAHEPISGLAEKRRTSLIAMDRMTLERRFRDYFDVKLTWNEVKPTLAGLAIDAACYPAEDTRVKLLARGERYDSRNIRRYAFLPLDYRYCYHSNSPPLWNRSRPELEAEAIDGNRFFITRGTARQPEEGVPALIVSALPDHHLLDPNVVAIPLRLRSADANSWHANLSILATSYLSALALDLSDDATHTLIWYHALAIVHAPRYLTENGEAVRADTPKIPLPDTPDALLRSAALGRQIADLLDPDCPVQGVTAGTISPTNRLLGVLRKQGAQHIDPARGDLALVKHWGRLQQNKVMPGPGYQTESTSDNMVLSWDIWLNESVYWSAVPDAVWNFTVGGFRILKKWLSYRDRSVLGRDLTLDEADYFTAMVRRIAAVLDLSPQLDDSYASAANAPWAPSASPPPSAVKRAKRT